VESKPEGRQTTWRVATLGGRLFGQKYGKKGLFKEKGNGKVVMVIVRNNGGVKVFPLNLKCSRKKRSTAGGGKKRRR